MESVRVDRESPTKLSVTTSGTSKMYVNGAARCLDRSEVEDHVRFVIESDSTRPQLLIVSGTDDASLEVLDALPHRSDPDVVRATLDRVFPPGPVEPVKGGIMLDDSVVTVRAGAQRTDFVVGSERLPNIDDVQMMERGTEVHLSLPDRTRLHLVVGPDDVDATHKAIAVIRATHRDEASEMSAGPGAIRWKYKVVKNLTANQLEDTLNSYGRGGWELVSMTGLDNVASITGNRLYAVLKKQI